MSASRSAFVAATMRALVEISHRHDCLAIVDAVTALGGTPIEVDAWGIDAVYSGSQKCLSCTPGISPVTFGERAIAKVRARKTPVQSWFMDLNLVLGYWSGEGKRTYHHTAPINPLYGLHEALLMVAEEGLENAWARHRAMHDKLRTGLEAMGIRFVVDEAARLPQLNSVYIPEGVDDAAARSRLINDLNLEIGAGLGALAGKIWRIGLMGYSAREENVAACLKAIKAVAV